MRRQAQANEWGFAINVEEMSGLGWRKVLMSGVKGVVGIVGAEVNEEVK